MLNEIISKHLNEVAIPKVQVVDLFCGIGGLSYGLRSSGLTVVSGYDIDSSCKFAYEFNNSALFFNKDIKKVTGSEISGQYDEGVVRVLAGCAPCQPFSSYARTQKKKDPNKYDLLYDFGRLIREVQPEIVTMENVIELTRFSIKPVLSDFVKSLVESGYFVTVENVFCPDYGIPQMRKRLVLLASKLGEIRLKEKTHTKDEYVTVGDVLKVLPPIGAGEDNPEDPLHKSVALSDLNMKRMQATPYGGSWKDWPENLQLKCHKKSSGKSYSSVYARMVWECPSPTITTECIGFGNGRFGHPVQNRAITAREAAILQTFPNSYRFFENDKLISINKAAQYIGNAVPPKLGEVIGESILNHIALVYRKKVTI